MRPEDVEDVVVVGAGVMGHGIAQIMAMSGMRVTLVDVSEEILRSALGRIRWSLEKLSKRKRLRENVDDVMTRLRITTDLSKAARDVDFALEAVPEKIEIKKQVFKKLDENSPSKAVLSTNTSTLSVTELSEVTGRPEKVVGMHFFNPPQLMKLVEVVRGEHTSDETVELVKGLARRLGKEVIICKKDVRGFIVNRVLMQVINEGLWALHRGEATREEIDSAARYSAGMPMGPVELTDFIGLDVLLDIMRALEKAYGERAKVCPLLEAAVGEGKLGRKSGAGFYDWSKGSPEIPKQLSGRFDARRLQLVAINEASMLIEEGAATAMDIDVGMKYGANWPRGPCELADEMGIDQVVKCLEDLWDAHRWERYKPSSLLLKMVSEGRLGVKSGRGFHEYG